MEIATAFLLGALLALVVGVAVAFWMYSDAKTRGVNSPVAWAIGVVAAAAIIGLIGVVLVTLAYFILRPKASGDGW